MTSFRLPQRVCPGIVAVSLVFIFFAGCNAADKAALNVNQDLAAISSPNETKGEMWLIPSTEPGFEMKTRVYKPTGDGPFRLAIINHGSAQDPAQRKRVKPSEYAELTDWFLRRGYVVAFPERPGHGSGGKYIEDQDGCDSANFERAGQRTADSIAAVLDYMRKQPFISPQGTIVAGHSAGAWGSLAYAARRPAGVIGVINFSGGRGGRHLNRPNNNCAPERLVATASRFGSTTNIPTLWLYAENDTYFPPSLSGAMANAFKMAGGNAEYWLLPSTGNEGHFVIRSEAWKPAVQQFLDARG
ncbi:prolyl oligopeptidase family serine peptidase [Mesorhizobium sp. KR9-304]|uniref:alpha/beta hydrolase family protein n=1 Tax=Mesorhizobium sp. KR9-304 TaxID=3156614 RepID=UPI0032B4063F